MFLAKVYVTPKPAVNDPQGVTVQGALHSLGFAGVHQVRMGKYLEVQIDAPNQAAASKQAEEMCRKLLANTVIEDFRFDVVELAHASR